MALIPAIRKEFDFSKIRDDLNIVATIFDDQTQLTTDRNSRACADAPRLCPCASCAPQLGAGRVCLMCSVDGLSSQAQS